MISDWVQNAQGSGTITVSLDDINKSGLTAGETAAVVVGSCFAAFVAVLTIGVAIKMIIVTTKPGFSGKMMM
jgi:hypothetical protein